jgi:hypothetical protein
MRVDSRAYTNGYTRCLCRYASFSSAPHMWIIQMEPPRGVFDRV